jgi:hypothetical protein
MISAAGSWELFGEELVFILCNLSSELMTHRKFQTVHDTVSQSHATVSALAVNNSFTLNESGLLEKDSGNWITDIVTDIEDFFLVMFGNS